MQYNDLGGDSNLDFDARFQADASLCKKSGRLVSSQRMVTHDLLDNLAGGVQVDQTLVDLQLVTIPGLGTLTTRLANRH